MRPGIVIITAILNFISAAFALFWAALFAIAIIFGNALGLVERVAGRIQEANLTISVNLAFTFFLIITAVFGALYLWLGVGLLKGKGLAWYLQVAASLMGLLFFPIGTVVNGVILVFFFMPATRSYFKV